MPTRDLTSFPVLSFSAHPGPDHLAVLLPVSNAPMLAILLALGWSLPPLSRRFCSVPMMCSSRFFAWCSVLSNFWIRPSPFLRHPCVTLTFCAFELLNSSLSPPSTSSLDSSATARLLSICELPLPAAAVTAFLARLFLGSESGGIGTSFRLPWCCQLSCCVSKFLPSSDVSLYFFCNCLVQHLSSSIQALRSFWSGFETFLDSDAARSGGGNGSILF